MDAMMIVVGLMAAGLGGYMAIWPEAAARRDNAGRAADPEPSGAYVLSTRLGGLTLLLFGVPAVLVGLGGWSETADISTREHLCHDGRYR